MATINLVWPEEFSEFSYFPTLCILQSKKGRKISEHFSMEVVFACNELQQVTGSLQECASVAAMLRILIKFILQTLHRFSKYCYFYN